MYFSFMFFRFFLLPFVFLYFQTIQPCMRPAPSPRRVVFSPPCCSAEAGESNALWEHRVKTWASDPRSRVTRPRCASPKYIPSSWGHSWWSFGEWRKISRENKCVRGFKTLFLSIMSSSLSRTSKRAVPYLYEVICCPYWTGVYILWYIFSCFMSEYHIAGGVETWVSKFKRAACMVTEVRGKKRSNNAAEFKELKDNQ